MRDSKIMTGSGRGLELVTLESKLRFDIAQTNEVEVVLKIDRRSKDTSNAIAVARQPYRCS